MNVYEYFVPIYLFSFEIFYTERERSGIELNK